MKKSFNILLATDFSEEVKNAERYAIQFALMTGSRLSILHVYNIPLSLPSSRDGFAQAAEDLRKHEFQRLERHCIKLFRSMNISKTQVPYECIVLEGTVTGEVTRESERLHSDLIVTGAHRGNGFWDFFRKNHTWGLMKKADIPVLSIPPEGNLKRIKKIVFATEYREGELPAIRFLANLAKAFDAELTILNITTNKVTREFESVARAVFFGIMSEADYDKINISIVHADDIVSGIGEYCEASGADWLVMTHSRMLLEKITSTRSITKEMSNNTHIPLLALPDYYYSPEA
jgi:nucleotide-binding universal stress UspA family protein